MTLKLEEKDDKKLHCKSGWYTERAMKDELKFTKSWPNTSVFFTVHPAQFQGVIFFKGLRSKMWLPTRWTSRHCDGLGLMFQQHYFSINS